MDTIEVTGDEEKLKLDRRFRGNQTFGKRGGTGLLLSRAAKRTDDSTVSWYQDRGQSSKLNQDVYSQSP